MNEIKSAKVKIRGDNKIIVGDKLIADGTNLFFFYMNYNNAQKLFSSLINNDYYLPNFKKLSKDEFSLLGKASILTYFCFIEKREIPYMIYNIIFSSNTMEYIIRLGEKRAKKNNRIINKKERDYVPNPDAPIDMFLHIDNYSKLSKYVKDKIFKKLGSYLNEIYEIAENSSDTRENLEDRENIENFSIEINLTNVLNELYEYFIILDIMKYSVKFNVNYYSDFGLNKINKPAQSYSKTGIREKPFYSSDNFVLVKAKIAKTNNCDLLFLPTVLFKKI